MEAKFIAFGNRRINLSHCAQYELAGNIIVFYGQPVYDGMGKQLDACPVMDRWEFNSPENAKAAVSVIDNNYVVRTVTK